MARKKKTENTVKKEEVSADEEKTTSKEAKEAKAVKETKEAKESKKTAENTPAKYDSIAFLVVGLIVGLAIGGLIFSSMTTTESAEAMSEDEITALGQAAVDFIGNSTHQLVPEDATVTLINATSVGDTGMYRIDFSLEYEGGEYTYESYISKDSELLCTSGIVIDEYKEELAQAMAEAEAEASMTTEEICAAMTKSESPVLEAYVVSGCPYGLQMQGLFAEIIANAPEAEQYLKIRYMGAVVDGEITSMHGDTEAQENLRQICIREEQSDLYWEYVGCFMVAGQVDECLAEAGVDTEALESCMTDPEKGMAYAEEDFTLNDQYGITGSPTLIMNGERVSEFDFGGRTAEAVKTTLCCGFNSEPSFCSTEMSTDSAASSGSC